MLKGNKGEWSEVYTLFKVLSDGNLYSGDGDLNKVKNLFFPIISVLRKESNGSFKFSIKDNLVLIDRDGEEIKILVKEFARLSKLLLRKIEEAPRGAGAFEIPMVEEFLESYGSNSLKAKSSSKSDIRIEIHDNRTGYNPKLGFSIKSQLGTASTLLNAGRTTNFIYHIEGLNELSNNQLEIVNGINTRSKIKDRLTWLQNHGFKLVFAHLENSIFQNNLILIDTALPTILSEMILDFYSSDKNKVAQLLDNLNANNPIKYDENSEQPFYAYKIKRLLSDIALGMTPSSTWNGILDATGGYLVVKEDGDVLCYHIYNRNEFESYLLKNTKFETASTSRHGFGSVYNEKGKSYIKLNLQIRFTK